MFDVKSGDVCLSNSSAKWECHYLCRRVSNRQNATGKWRLISWGPCGRKKWTCTLEIPWEPKFTVSQLWSQSQIYSSKSWKEKVKEKDEIVSFFSNPNLTIPRYISMFLSDHKEDSRALAAVKSLIWPKSVTSICFSENSYSTLPCVSLFIPPLKLRCLRGKEASRLTFCGRGGRKRSGAVEWTYT